MSVLGGLCDLLLHEYEAPELVYEPVIVGLTDPYPCRCGANSGPFVGIPTEIDQIGQSTFWVGAPQGTIRVIGETILVVVDPHRSE